MFMITCSSSDMLSFIHNAATQISVGDMPQSNYCSRCEPRRYFEDGEYQYWVLEEHRHKPGTWYESPYCAHCHISQLESQLGSVKKAHRELQLARAQLQDSLLRQLESKFEADISKRVDEAIAQRCKDAAQRVEEKAIATSPDATPPSSSVVGRLDSATSEAADIRSELDELASGPSGLH